MDTPYEKLDETTRAEWRDHPTTLAFLGTVKSLLDQDVGRALNTLAGGGFLGTHAVGGAFEGGRISAYRYILDIASRPGKASDE